MNKILSLLFLIISFKAYTQNIIVSGSVKSSVAGEPVAGASIVVKDKLSGTVTDAKGDFNLSLSKLKLPVILVVSATGYSDEEVLIKDLQKISVQLKQKETLLNEIVFGFKGE